MARIVARRILPLRVLGKRGHDGGLLECGHGSDALAHERHQFGLQLVAVGLDARLQHDEPDRDLTLQLVGDTDHGALGHQRVRGDHLFHGARRQTVAGHVDHVVDTSHHVQVAVVVVVPAVTGDVVARVRGEIALDESGIVVPESRQGAGRQRQLDRHRAFGVGVEFLPRCRIEHLDAVAGHRFRRRSRLHRQRLDAHAVRDDRPAGFGLPPVVDDRPVEQAARPVVRVGVEAFTGEEQVPEGGQVVARQVRAMGILLLDRAERGGRGEKRLHLVVLR